LIRKLVRYLRQSRTHQAVPPLIDELAAQIRVLHENIDLLRAAIGRVEQRQSADSEEKLGSLPEFKVFSQFGEDGTIAYLIERMRVRNRSFIEFGVERYQECNTRFLSEAHGWSGLVIECNSPSARMIRRLPVSWKNGMTIVEEFVTVENVNELFARGGYQGDIGLLSVDIDGNDYWVFNAARSVRPAIAVVEFNALFGANRAVTIPYQPSFDFVKAHYSMLYWGASLKALETAAITRGMHLVGINSAGNNAFFVDSVWGKDIPKVRSEDVWHPAQFHLARTKEGKIADLDCREQLELIADTRLIDVASGKEIATRDLLSN
jgi:hypothetical protein